MIRPEVDVNIQAEYKRWVRGEADPRPEDFLSFLVEERGAILDEDLVETVSDYFGADGHDVDADVLVAWARGEGYLDPDVSAGSSDDL